MYRFALGLAAALALLGCDSTDAPSTAQDEILRPRSRPIEFVGLTVTKRVVHEDQFLEIAGPMFGAPASSGTHHADYEIQRGLFLTTSTDPRTDEQAVVRLDMVPSGTEERRTILRVPASYEYGQLYIETVRVALARTAEVAAADPDGMHPWHIEYHTASVNGGYMVMKVNYAEGETTFTLQTENPQTSLTSGEVNTPAFEGDPYEKLAGTVFFELSRDEFGFFSNRAYGVTSGAEQNFDDFKLLPHDWLRITVTPRLEDQMVDVAFEVVTLDGSRVPFARAPASLLAGEQFQQNVFRMVDNMTAQEREEPGSSTPFTVPFHYDDPQGGGVVKVIAEGETGDFRIAYAVDSPLHRLRDVEFLPYAGDLEIPDGTEPMAPVDCSDIGSRPADTGRFVMQFDASETVRESERLTDPLAGPVWGSVYREEDVTISGPKDGAEPVATFHFEDVDMNDGLTAMEYEIPADIPAGAYQILGFMDIDGNAAEMDNDPDVGDPVTLPIGGYDLECARQPVVVEFALLLPEGR